MHQDVTGNWAASTYSSKGDRMDHLLSLSSSGSFRWTREWNRDAGQRRDERAGAWTHDAEQDVLRLTSTAPGDDSETVLWSIHYISGCEDSNLILALRWLAIASRNLPIYFQRVHPPDDPVWRAEKPTTRTP